MKINRIKNEHGKSQKFLRFFNTINIKYSNSKMEELCHTIN